jgi:hypothetical protein
VLSQTIRHLFNWATLCGSQHMGICAACSVTRAKPPVVAIFGASGSMIIRQHRLHLPRRRHPFRLLLQLRCRTHAAPIWANPKQGKRKAELRVDSRPFSDTVRAEHLKPPPTCLGVRLWHWRWLVIRVSTRAHSGRRLPAVPRRQGFVVAPCMDTAPPGHLRRRGRLRLRLRLVATR